MGGTGMAAFYERAKLFPQGVRRADVHGTTKGANQTSGLQEKSVAKFKTFSWGSLDLTSMNDKIGTRVDVRASPGEAA
jgi:hypothetical protein